MIRTRIAPSPTGYPHIGTVYQALFNFAYANKYNGSFIVRTEDTDRLRFVDDAEDMIFQILDWLGLTENESTRKPGEFGPYRQSERLSIYHQYAQELIDRGNAYFAYYRKEESGQSKDAERSHKTRIITQSDEKAPVTIAEMIERKDWVVRMKVPQGESLTFTDQIRGDITFPTSEITEQVLIKSDGYPTYHLAVVVDDHLMKISHILRAEEWLSSTPKHVILYRYFGWEMPPVYHTATLRNPDKSKLSKRHGHTNVVWFKEQGYLPEAILNYLALLGWSHPQEKEIFSLAEFIKLFELKDIRPIAPIFDVTKLTWMNQQYIQSKNINQLEEIITGFYPDALKLSPETLERLLPLVHSRMHILADFEKLTAVFFTAPQVDFTKSELLIAQDLLTEFSRFTQWNHDIIFITMRDIMSKHNVKMPVLYTILTGQPSGLPLPQTIEILGKEKTITRLSDIVKV